MSDYRVTARCHHCDRLERMIGVVNVRREVLEWGSYDNKKEPLNVYALPDWARLADVTLACGHRTRIVTTRAALALVQAEKAVA